MAYDEATTRAALDEIDRLQAEEDRQRVVDYFAKVTAWSGGDRYDKDELRALFAYLRGRVGHEVLLEAIEYATGIDRPRPAS